MCFFTSFSVVFHVFYKPVLLLLASVCRNMCPTILYKSRCLPYSKHQDCLNPQQYETLYSLYCFVIYAALFLQQVQTVAVLMLQTLLPNAPAVNIVKPAATAAVANIVQMTAPAVYAKKERNKLLKAVNQLQRASAKP